MHANARWVLLVVVVCSVFSMAPGRCREAAGGFFSGDPAPDLRGNWNIAYDDEVSIEVEVDGQTYTGSIFGTAGNFSFEHNGEDYTFDLDCTQPAIVCPSEIFPDRVTLEQRSFEDRPHQVHMPVNESECRGETRLPDEAAGECGGETGVPCDVEICEGTMVEAERVSLGAISEPEAEVGDTPAYVFSLSLGGAISGFTTGNGLCVGLATSHAEADIVYDGTYDPDTNAMYGTDLANGEIVLTLAGGCLIAAAGGGSAGVAMAGASVHISTGFTADRAVGR